MPHRAGPSLRLSAGAVRLMPTSSTLSALLTLWAKLDLEADPLIDLRPFTKTLERLDMNKDVLATLGGLDEAKSALIVP